jgi:ankyrin repeat protein
MDLIKHVRQLWVDLEKGETELVIAYFAAQSSISLSKTASNSVIPFVGRHQGHDGIRRFFSLRSEAIETLETFVYRIHQDCNTVFVNLNTHGICKDTGKEYRLDDLHLIDFNDSELITEWNIYADISELIAAFQPTLPKRLLDAVASNDLDEVKELLIAGADPNARDQKTGLTALMMAACRAQVEIVQFLLDAGADIFTTDSNTGATALHKACQGQSAVIAKMLTDAGAFIDAVTPTMGHTPIMDALWYLAPDVVQHLVSCKPNLNTKTHYGFSLWDHLEYETKVQATEKGRTTMAGIKASIEGYRDQCDTEIAQQMVMNATEKGDAELVQQLIAQGSPVNTVYPHVNTFSDGHTPLIVAARDNHLDIVKFLLDAGAETDVHDWVFKGYPLHKATYNGRSDVLKVLLGSPKMTADVINVQGQINGYTPLADALWHGFEECANILLDHPQCRVGNVAHDGKDELAVAEQVFGTSHPITQRILAMTLARSQ